MMSSKLVRPSTGARGPARWVDIGVGKLRNAYKESLDVVLALPWLIIPFILAAVGGSVFLFSQLPSELTPPEDRGNFFSRFSAADGASFEYTAEQAGIIEDILMEYVEAGELRRVLVVVPGFGGGSDFSSGTVVGTMTPWGDAGLAWRSSTRSINAWAS